MPSKRFSSSFSFSLSLSLSCHNPHPVIVTRCAGGGARALRQKTTRPFSRFGFYWTNDHSQGVACLTSERPFGVVFLSVSKGRCPKKTSPRRTPGWHQVTLSRCANKQLTKTQQHFWFQMSQCDLQNHTLINLKRKSPWSPSDIGPVYGNCSLAMSQKNWPLPHTSHSQVCKIHLMY